MFKQALNNIIHNGSFKNSFELKPIIMFPTFKVENIQGLLTLSAKLLLITGALPVNGPKVLSLVKGLFPLMCTSGF